jgi:hypothetical protein
MELVISVVLCGTALLTLDRRALDATEPGTARTIERILSQRSPRCWSSAEPVAAGLEKAHAHAGPDTFGLHCREKQAQRLVMKNFTGPSIAPSGRYRTGPSPTTARGPCMGQPPGHQRSSGRLAGCLPRTVGHRNPGASGSVNRFSAPSPRTIRPPTGLMITDAVRYMSVHSWKQPDSHGYSGTSSGQN